MREHAWNEKPRRGWAHATGSSMMIGAVAIAIMPVGRNASPIMDIEPGVFACQAPTAVLSHARATHSSGGGLMTCAHCARCFGHATPAPGNLRLATLVKAVGGGRWSGREAAMDRGKDGGGGGTERGADGAGGEGRGRGALWWRGGAPGSHASWGTQPSSVRVIAWAESPLHRSAMHHKGRPRSLAALASCSEGRGTIKFQLEMHRGEVRGCGERGSAIRWGMGSCPVGGYPTFTHHAKHPLQ